MTVAVFKNTNICCSADLPQITDRRFYSSWQITTHFHCIIRFSQRRTANPVVILDELVEDLGRVTKRRGGGKGEGEKAGKNSSQIFHKLVQYGDRIIKLPLASRLIQPWSPATVLLYLLYSITFSVLKMKLHVYARILPGLFTTYFPFLLLDVER